jgi:hypothetical protein
VAARTGNAPIPISEPTIRAGNMFEVIVMETASREGRPQDCASDVQNYTPDFIYL